MRRRHAEADTTVDAPTRWALYLRVSTDEQVERGTIKAQLEYLRQRVALDTKGREMQGLPPIIVAGEYADEGISGTVPMADRPQGRRLLEDARAGLFSAVVVYRLDRLGRRMRVVLDAHDALEQSGVAVISATEPFDTSTSFGKAMFQFLGLMAELERSTISERFTNGRDTAIRGGKWTNGPIPFGYVTDEGGYLAISDLAVPGTGMTEAEIARGIFERLAEGETSVAVCRWMNALGVPTVARYANGKLWELSAPEWRPARVNHMVKRTLYSGTWTYRSRRGQIITAVPAIVSPDMQHRAITRLAQGLAKPSHASRVYILTGVLRCGSCGKAYTGWANRRRGRDTGGYYRCVGASSQVSIASEGRCRAKIVRAAEVEAAVVAFVRSIYTNPQDFLADAQAALRERTGATAGLDDRAEALTRRLAALDAERQRVLTLCKRGVIGLDEAEAALDATKADVGAVQAELAGLRAQRDLAEAAESRLTEAAALISEAGRKFDTLTPEQMAEAIRRIVREVVVQTVEVPRGRSRKDYRLEARVLWGPPEDVPHNTPADTAATHNNSHGVLVAVHLPIPAA